MLSTYNKSSLKLWHLYVFCLNKNKNAFTLTKNDKETKIDPDKIGTVPNSKQCWCWCWWSVYNSALYYYIYWTIKICLESRSRLLSVWTRLNLGNNTQLRTSPSEGYFYCPQFAKVMFLHVSVILSTGGGWSTWAGTPPGRYIPPGRYPSRCMLRDTGNKRAVRILLECILVLVLLFALTLRWVSCIPIKSSCFSSSSLFRLCR